MLIELKNKDQRTMVIISVSVAFEVLLLVSISWLLIWKRTFHRSKVLMKYAMPGKKLYSSLENSWVFQNLDLYKEKFKQLRGQGAYSQDNSHQRPSYKSHMFHPGHPKSKKQQHAIYH
nr:hypothetical protein CFP56_52093 [Quercus suber]